MLNLAILVLLVLVVGTLWLLLRPAAPPADAGATEGTAPRTEGDDLTVPLGLPEVRDATPHQSDERLPNH